MKKLLFHVVILFAALLLTPPASAVPWVSRHGLNAAAYQSEFNKWTGAPYSYRLISVAGYEEAGTARYMAVWEKRSGPGWLTHHQLSSAQYNSLRDHYAQSGFHPVFLSGFGVAGQANHNSIWEYAPGADVVSRVGLSYGTYVEMNSANIQKGYKLVFVWTFNGGASGTGEYFNAIWRKDVSEGYAVRVRRTSNDYQTVFNDLSGQGYELQAVSTAQVSGTDRYTSVWKRPGAGETWYSHHGLSGPNYQGATWNAYYQGYRPVFGSAFMDSGAPRFNVIFRRNGGMGWGDLTLISDTVKQYMEDNDVPGLSLAIARQGQLVYARGFGMADKGAGELVHPHHRFRIASIAKPITAAAVSKLVDDGLLTTLDRQVFGAGDILGTTLGTSAYSSWERAITVRNLLHHTTGWTSDGQLWNNAYGTDHNAIIGWQLDNADPSSAPGMAYQYMNTDYVTAGRVIETLSGQTYERYVQDNILAPSCVTQMEIGGQTLAERRWDEVVYYGSNPYVNIHPGRMDANGGWIAKPMDLLLFLRRINSDSTHPDILSAASMTAMRTGSAPNMGYGLGTLLQNGWWGHNGCMDGTISFLVQRNDGLQFAVTCNSRPAGDSCAWTLRSVIDGLVDTLDAAGAWPEYDLFPCVNPSYRNWVLKSFPRGVLTQPQLKREIWGPGSDVDRDGLVAAVEAYFGTDPMTADELPMWYGVDGRDFVVRWRQPENDPGVELRSKYATSVRPRAWSVGPDIEPVPAGTVGNSGQILETRMSRDDRPQHFQQFEVITR